MTAKPDLNNSIAANALVNAASNRLHLGQFWHRLIVEDREWSAARFSRFLSRIVSQFRFFLRHAALQRPPLLKIHNPKHKTYQEDPD